MFGFLKKKLKEGIEKISKTVSKKEEEKIKEAVEEVKREEQLEESKEKLVKEVEEEIEKPEEKIEEKVEEEPLKEEKIEEEIEKKFEEEKTSEKAVELFEEEVEEKFIKEQEKELEEPSEEEIKEIEEKAKIEEKPKQKKGFLDRLLKRKPKEVKVEKGIIEKIKKKITEKKIEEEDIKDILKDLEMTLLSSDVAVEVTEKICNDLKQNLVGKFIKRKEIEKIIKESFRKSILEVLDVESFDLIEKIKTKKPFLIVFLGFNGSGKTTSIAKIGHLLQKNNLECVFAAGDSWRAAAIEQIEEHGKKLGINVIKHKYGADPAAVIFDAVKHAQSKNIDVILSDTAGRSHANVNLMEELKKIIKVNKPDLKILVLDALTGNDIYDQCKTFNDAVGVDALILTKADVYEKGGAALSASHTINRPILYLGVGQKYEDMEKFEPDKIVEKLLE